MNNKELCRSSIAPCIKQLPSLKNASEDFWNLIKRVFAYDDSNELYLKYSIIYLMQPNDYGLLEIDRINLQIEQILGSKEGKCIARPHPRQENILNSVIYMDYSRDIWELLCVDKISDNHILISMCSTAQLIPKMLFNKEPYLIFTYKLFKNVLPNEVYNKIENMVENIKSVYQDKTKIYVPTNIEEVQMCLKIEGINGKKY